MRETPNGKENKRIKKRSEEKSFANGKLRKSGVLEKSLIDFSFDAVLPKIRKATMAGKRKKLK